MTQTKEAGSIRIGDTVYNKRSDLFGKVTSISVVSNTAGILLIGTDIAGMLTKRTTDLVEL